MRSSRAFPPLLLYSYNRVDADTTLLQTTPLEFVVSYNKYFHPVDGAPGCTSDKPAHGVCSTAFAMKISVVHGV